MIEGELVKVKARAAGSRFRFCQLDGELLGGYYVDGDIDIFDGEECLSKGHHEALVLIKQSDVQNRSKIRLVLMLLKWVSNGIAERTGLLGDTCRRWDRSFIESIPRTRWRFELR